MREQFRHLKQLIQIITCTIDMLMLLFKFIFGSNQFDFYF